ncbi:MAG: hypothetical protein QXR60_04415 [Candidatus Nanoarchaeia archaeon]
MTALSYPDTKFVTQAGMYPETYSEPYSEQPSTVSPPQTPQAGMMPYPGQDPQFLQWLFNFKKEVSVPLRYLWRGYEQGEDGIWRPKYWDEKVTTVDGKTVVVKKTFRVMNEKGITWAISFIESFINPVYVVSNYDTVSLNWTMRHVGRTVYNNLSFRYKEFGLNKLDIQRVGIEVISKVHAILLGAKDNGYRRFFSTTHQHQEVKAYNENQTGGQGFMGIFRGLRQAGRNEPPFENRNY